MREMIKIENLGKQYRTIREGEQFNNFKESLTGMLKKKPNEKFWVFQNLNFSAMPGSIIGLVGPNGSGKTTLLNIIAKITEPTEGKIVYRGRVGALLGANTGFHIDLNGIDNIYLLSSVMGFSKKEIDRHINEIVDFAGVRDFIRLPVKRLSTGMKMKLGIAIVMVLMPEIFIFDEVISIVDKQFLNKVYIRLTDETLKERVVFMVSHNADFIQKHCNMTLDITQFHQR